MDSEEIPVDNSNDATATYYMEKCKRKRCVTCANRLCLDNFVDNHVTGERFCISSNGSCDTKNCVYVVKCGHPGCQYQYVGHTINSVAARISSHKSTILKGGGCKVLKDHFTGIHSVDNARILPIALLPKNITLKQREDIEDSWMLKLNTVFPYGLNVRVKKTGIMDASVDVLRSKDTIYSKFNVLKVERHCRGDGSKASNEEVGSFIVDEFYSSLFMCLDNVNLRNIRTSLCNLKKKQLKSVYIKAIALINDGLDSLLKYHLCLLVKDLCWFYLLRMGAQKEKVVSLHFCVVQYVNKFIEHVNFKKIFNSETVFNASPFTSCHLSNPRISFEYPRTIKSKVLNYREVYNSDLDPVTMSCSCQGSKFYDDHHGHIITGDLSLVTDPCLRRLLQKGLNFRDQAPPSTKKAFSAIKKAIIRYCKKMARRYCMSIVLFNEWQHKFLMKYKSNSVPVRSTNLTLFYPSRMLSKSWQNFMKIMCWSPQIKLLII